MLLLTFQGCKKRSEMAEVLYKKTQNKVFKDITPEEFAAFFKKHLLRNNPILIIRHLLPVITSNTVLSQCY
jgi:hypothetical protein